MTVFHTYIPYSIFIFFRNKYIFPSPRHGELFSMFRYDEWITVFNFFPYSRDAYMASVWRGKGQSCNYKFGRVIYENNYFEGAKYKKKTPKPFLATQISIVEKKKNSSTRSLTA